MLLSELANAAQALVVRAVVGSAEVSDVTVRRLGELGFIPGEPVRLVEAQCIEVTALVIL